MEKCKICDALDTLELDNVHKVMVKLKREKDALLTACESARNLCMDTLCEHDQEPCPDNNECRVCQITRILETAIRQARGRPEFNDLSVNPKNEFGITFNTTEDFEKGDDLQGYIWDWLKDRAKLILTAGGDDD